MNIISTSYEDGLQNYHLSSSRACGVTVIVLVLLGIALDYVLYPLEQSRFALARLITSLFIALALLLLYTETGKRHVKSITFVWMMFPQIMIAWMIYTTQGESSLFYAGIILAIFAIGTLFPVGYLYTLEFGLLTLFYYYLACSLRDNGIQDTSQYAFHSIIILFATLGSTVYTYFNEKIRRQLFSLKEEVTRQNEVLAQTNKNLANIKGQMLQQEKMAAIGTLAAGLLHEVNNPVNYCLMAINIALEEPVAKTNASLNECLVDAKQGMQRIQHIVSDLKTFAYRKSDASADGTVFLLEKVVDSALRLVSHETKGVSISRDMPSDTLVRGDEAAIIGVLVNLLSNAALAMRAANRRNPEIHVSAAWIGERLFVTVQDNGPGIPPENLSRVFEPFFTTREIGQGLGLGLSISYSVIEQHGGVLHAESELGEWTKMIFDLPRAS
jgi:two-component system sensor histidine kinase PhcS